MLRTTTEFFDLAVGQFYADPVTWLAGEEIRSGTSPTTFSPDKAVTRAEMPTFLWRLAGEPAVLRIVPDRRSADR